MQEPPELEHWRKCVRRWVQMARLNAEGGRRAVLGAIESSVASSYRADCRLLTGRRVRGKPSHQVNLIDANPNPLPLSGWSQGGVCYLAVIKTGKLKLECRAFTNRAFDAYATAVKLDDLLDDR
jgi:hypothetical protein